MKLLIIVCIIVLAIAVADRLWSLLMRTPVRTIPCQWQWGLRDKTPGTGSWEPLDEDEDDEDGR